MPIHTGISIKDLKNELLHPTPLKMKMDCGRSRFDPRVRQHSFVKISYGIICTAIISLPLIQIGQLSISGEKMCT